MHRQFCENAMDTTTGDMLEYCHLIKGSDRKIWATALVNDPVRLTHGVSTRMKKGANAIFFIHPSKIPTKKRSA